jgi:hypothetical protein
MKPSGPQSLPHSPTWQSPVLQMISRPWSTILEKNNTLLQMAPAILLTETV